ncbi:MAP kinase kinase kinase [Komagataella phaffii CBS 7435]|uniref:Mitogen-activated protein (MAP) kinase kinase kinase n=2 Tax=Komagataella phaffii TaxID=460519 RepID=C4R3W5_KOMPG|nr:Mitogen-activated protein (MAP) kinase kinase kinase [Komagataella phaffii GS115]AOA63360.1 GQ67_03264T0 [Komagataella phaffii]CAH2450008.1 MAP kinase kinase kinase [Komagataella phaffii CBS 7435]AOA68866.1 GQ68_03233T0 [Komagataella phaffii GS115]CAY70224.1 Mitogen-activated protein (MAP) kinase kinase kinase [Komagataella phaffii GS115]CCA39953.1 MAP kinase kinase kinase [Komagataella phaffii CBS 7435]
METDSANHLDPVEPTYDTTLLPYLHSRKSSRKSFGGDDITNPNADLSTTPSRIPLPSSFMSEEGSKGESRFSFELNGMDSSTPEKSAWTGILESPKPSESFSFFTEHPSIAHFNNSSGNHIESLSNSTSPSNADSDLSKRLSRIKKSATHSRQSSISWNVDLPEEWTLNNITFWLNLYNFNESWLSMIKAHNLVGASFLSLANYPVLKTYTHEVDTVNDSTPSRFIHLLRKTMGRKTSETLSLASANVNDYYASNVSAESFDSIIQSPVEEFHETSNLETKSSSESPKSSVKHFADPAKLTTNIPKPSPLRSSSPSSSSTTLKHSVSQRTTNTRQATENVKRPVSTIEYSTSRSDSPTSTFSYNVFRKHQKSNSSESNFFSKIYSNAPTNEVEVERRSSVKSKKGLLTKFKKIGEEISKSNKSRDKLSESPISPASATSLVGGKDRWKRHQSSVTTELSNKDWKQASRKSVDKTKNNVETNKERLSISKKDKVLSDIYEKHKPTPLKDTHTKTSSSFVLATSNDNNFIPIDVSEVQDLRQFKVVVIKALNIMNIEPISFHLTDFGHIHGAELDDESLEKFRLDGFRNGSLKLHVKGTKFETSSSTASSMTLSFKSIEEGKLEKGSSRYPTTPQYLLDTMNAHSKDMSVDYLNIKDKVRESQELKNELVPQSASTTTVPMSKERSFSFRSTKEEHQNNTFRVIRNKSWEVDFDKKRKSPYERTRQLVAKRDPPPPPSPYSPPKNSLANREKRELPVLNPANQSSATSRTFGLDHNLEFPSKTNDEPTRISPFTPGSSNTLIPKPYKGSSPHERRPVLSNERRGSRRRSSSLLTTSSIVSGNSYQNFNTKSESFHDPSSGDSHGTFEESNTFDELPTFDISNPIESCSEEEEEDFWAKPPSSTTNTQPAAVAIDAKEDQEEKITRMPSMAVRPPAEVVYDNLELFFPNTDLDKPLMDDASPPPSPNSPIPEVSPVNNTRPQIHRKISSVRSASDHLARPNELGRGRVKTIRIVAQEAKKSRARLAENFESNKKADGLLRRRSTKFWGRKVVEMKPGDARNLSKLKDGNGDYKQFSWVRGEMIGKGTYGKVFLALNVTTGEMMAVKQVDLPSSGHNSSVFKEVVDAILSEVDTLSDLDHDNIVQYLGFEQRAQTYTLFLEYVAGGSVGWCLRVFGRFPEEVIRFLTKQVLEGLAYIHSRGILHRDLKGDNLLLETDGTCKITDFGISKRSRNIYSNDAEMSMQGSIFWMAPEVIDNVVNDKKQGYSAKVDVWSLGCVVLEMFAGKRPWSNFEVISAMYNLGRSKSAPPISDEVKAYISSDGIDFINKCFTVDPDERPTAQSLICHPFCKTSSDFKFESTELAKLVKVNDKQANLVFE